MKKYITTKIDDTTYMISEYIGGVHSYLLIGQHSAALIDTGNGAGRLDNLVKSLTTLPLTVLNTHGHMDHIGGNYLFALSRMSAKDKETVQIFSDKAFLKKSFNNIIPAILRPLAKLLVPYMTEVKPFCVRYDLTDGVIIDLGGRTLEVIPIAGHTPGSVAFYERSSDRLYCGDSIVKTRVLLNLECSLDVNTYLESLISLSSKVGTMTKLFTGHVDSPIAASYIDNYIECASAAISGRAEFSQGKESGALCTYADYAGVSLALKRDD